jgi:predicted aspartyl protease
MNLNYRCKHEKLGAFTVKRPIIPVYLVGKEDRKMQLTAILDSGSDFILIPREIADVLKLEYDEGNTDEANSYDGSKIISTQSKVRVIIEKDRELQPVDCKCAILLSKNYDHEELIFGSSFFEKFKIIFDYPLNKFTIKSAKNLLSIR